MLHWCWLYPVEGFDNPLNQAAIKELNEEAWERAKKVPWLIEVYHNDTGHLLRAMTLGPASRELHFPIPLFALLSLLYHPHCS